MSSTETEAQIWQIDLNAFPQSLSPWEAFLSLEEKERAHRFHFEKDRRACAIGRALLRILLGDQLGKDPTTLPFDCTEHGRPFLKDPSFTGDFNLSHSQDKMAIAIATKGHVGVDLEWIRPHVSYEAIARRYFSPEESAHLHALEPDERPAAFFRYWTLKEAYVKAQGHGLSYPLDHFSVRWESPDLSVSLSFQKPPSPAISWQLEFLKTFPGYISAFAARGPAKIKTHFNDEIETRLKKLKLVKG